MDQESSGKKKLPGWVKAIIISLSVIIGILIIVFLFVLYKWHRADYLTADMFRAKNQNEIPVAKVNALDETSGNQSAASYIDGDVITFKGQKYKYNDNLVNILVMGIDDKDVNKKSEEDINPHQADTIVVATVDSVKKTVSFISVPRDTVTDIKVLDINDEIATTVMGPIAIQHSFGTQGDKTNDTVVETVSELLYNVPIYRYVSIDLTAIPDINDSLGGIRVDITEDLTKWNSKMKEGTKDYLLKGMDATIFVARRDTSIDDSAMGRMRRQVQYMKKLFPAFKEKTKENLTYPITLYNQEADKISTNLTIDEMTYLAKLLINLELDESNISSVPGKMKRIEPGEIEDYEYEMGYIVDEDELKQLIIDRFYIKLDE